MFFMIEEGKEKRLVQREYSAAETLFLLSFNNSGEWITVGLQRNYIPFPAPSLSRV